MTTNGQMPSKLARVEFKSPISRSSPGRIRWEGYSWTAVPAHHCPPEIIFEPGSWVWVSEVHGLTVYIESLEHLPYPPHAYPPEPAPHQPQLHQVMMSKAVVELVAICLNLLLLLVSTTAYYSRSQEPYRLLPSMTEAKPQK